MQLNPIPNIKEFIPCKADLANPNTDWKVSWSLCRQQGIHPDMASFLWKMIHNLLSTQYRLHRLGASPSPTFTHCKESDGTLRHELVECSSNNNVGQLLTSCLQTYLPDLTPSSLLRLEFPTLYLLLNKYLLC